MNQFTAKKILLIDDEQAIAETIQAYAKKDNLEVTCALDGEVGLKLFQEQPYDLILLDWMLPGISGLDLIKLIRQKNNTPILMISARNDETDIVLGLEMGADDYITKPFGPRELIARVHSLLRRSNTAVADESTASDFILGNLKLSFEKRELLKNDHPVQITSTEFRILEALVTNLGKVVSREELMTKALGYNDFLNDRTLDTHIKNLRRKIETDPKQPQYIKTIRELGFKFVFPENL